MFAPFKNKTAILIKGNNYPHKDYFSTFQYMYILIAIALEANISTHIFLNTKLYSRYFTKQKYQIFVLLNTNFFTLQHVFIVNLKKIKIIV